MSEKKRSAALDFLVYAAIRFVVCVLQALPFALACRFAAFLAWLGYHLDKRHREVAKENLRHAFPGRYSETELKRLVRRVYQHFCLLIVEIVHLQRRLHRENWKDHIEYRTEAEGRQLLVNILSGRPILLATGHFGNWELSSYVLGLIGFKINAIARPIDNPYLDAYMRRFREAQGQSILNKNGDFDKIQRVLDDAGILGTLADQDAGAKGLFVDFFNRPASTHKALALLALEHRVVIIVLAAARVGRPLQYRALVEDVIDPDEYAGRPDAVKALTQRYMSAIQRMVAEYPEQYFWLHRRWKHQPAAKKKRAA
jgi:KDO2-lipid IV(A) lauroyltransferase